MINIQILTWDQLSDEDKVLYDERVKQLITYCNESNKQVDSCALIGSFIILNDTNLMEDIMMIVDYKRGFELTHDRIVLHHSIENQQQVKKQIESILNMKDFW